MGSGFSNKLILYYLRRIVRNELSRPFLLRRIVRGELSCAELSGHPIDIGNLSAITMHSSKGNSSPSRNKSRTHIVFLNVSKTIKTVQSPTNILNTRY